MTATTATPEQIKEMRAAADAALERMAKELAPMGVTATVAAIVLPENVPQAQRIAVYLNGTGESIINLVGALAMSMMPEDYFKLFDEMCRNPIFLHILDVYLTQQKHSQKPTMVN